MTFFHNRIVIYNNFVKMRPSKKGQKLVKTSYNFQSLETFSIRTYKQISVLSVKPIFRLFMKVFFEAHFLYVIFKVNFDGLVKCRRPFLKPIF